MNTEDEEIQEPPTPATGDTLDDFDSGDREVVRHPGWSDLLWSFLASGCMTVSNHQSR